MPGSYTILHPLGSADDFALLKLKKEVKSRNFIRLSGEHHKIGQDSKLCIFGYPFDKYFQQSKDKNEEAATQWGVIREGRVVEVKGGEGKILHQISTLPGHSGSPIIKIEEDGTLSIVGIHQGGSKDNYGRLVTPDFIKTVEAAATAIGAEFKATDCLEFEQAEPEECERERR